MLDNNNNNSSSSSNNNVNNTQSSVERVDETKRVEVQELGTRISNMHQ